MDTQLGARHRRRTPTIHRGSTQRTISAGSWFWGGPPDPAVRPPVGLLVTRQRSGTGRPSVEEHGRVRRPCPNQRNKSDRKENTRQPQLCSMPPWPPSPNPLPHGERASNCSPAGACSSFNGIGVGYVVGVFLSLFVEAGTETPVWVMHETDGGKKAMIGYRKLRSSPDESIGTRHARLVGFPP